MDPDDLPMIALERSSGPSPSTSASPTRHRRRERLPTFSDKDPCRALLPSGEREPSTLRSMHFFQVLPEKLRCVDDASMYELTPVKKLVVKEKDFHECRGDLAELQERAQPNPPPREPPPPSPRTLFARSCRGGKQFTPSWETMPREHQDLKGGRLDTPSTRAPPSEADGSSRPCTASAPVAVVIQPPHPPAPANGLNMSRGPTNPAAPRTPRPASTSCSRGSVRAVNSQEAAPKLAIQAPPGEPPKGACRRLRRTSAPVDLSSVMDNDGDDRPRRAHFEGQSGVGVDIGSPDLVGVRAVKTPQPPSMQFQDSKSPNLHRRKVTQSVDSSRRQSEQARAWTSQQQPPTATRASSLAARRALDGVRLRSSKMAVSAASTLAAALGGDAF